MVQQSFRNNIIRGSIWSVIGQFSSLFMMLLTNIWLARLLSPKEFGQLGLIIFFVTVLEVLTEGGLSGALIRKPNASKKDYSTIFIFNLVISVFCAIVLILSSRMIASYYNDLELQRPLIIISSVLIINSLQIVQNTKLMADMKYKEKSIYFLFAVSISCILGIASAYNGFGLWSLIIMYISRSFIYTAILWIFERFYFTIIFSKDSFRELYGFGVNTTIASFLNMVFDNIYQLIIGKMLSVNQVGLFYQAKKLQDVSNNVFIYLNQGVFFSSLSKIQQNISFFTKTYYKLFVIVLSIIGFTTLLIYFYADILIYILFGEKWINSVFYLKFITIASFFYILENFNRVIFKVFNKTRKLLYLDFLKRIIQLVSIFLGLYYSNITILLIGYIITNIAGYLLNCYFSKNIILVGAKKEIIIVLSTIFILIAIVSISVVLKTIFNIEELYSLLLLIFIIPTYIILLFVFKIITPTLIKM